ncbi:MAG TPA: HAD family phosphatase, partial [Verrucomicrobiota bacterium]|nr:HAD family phosphatase [Verrucomicrobiota bacterium]
RQYKNLPTEKVKVLAKKYYDTVFKEKIFSKAVNTLKEFKDNNYRIVLVSGGVDFLLKPFAEELNADCIAISLIEKVGFFTGEIKGVPLTGQIKANLLRQHSDKNNIDLSGSYALGDSYNDMKMMECVGHPIAVNPDIRLHRIARKKGWQIVCWND